MKLETIVDGKSERMAIRTYNEYQISNIFTNTGIEYEIRNYCGRKIGTDGNSNFTLPQI